MKTVIFRVILACSILQEALSENVNLGVFRYQELRFDEAGFPQNIAVAFSFPPGMTNHPSVVVAYRENAATNSPGRYELFGGPAKPAHILPNGSVQWLIQIDIDHVVSPGHFTLHGRRHWRMPISASREMVVSTNQGLVPLLVLDGLLICVEVSADYPEDGLVTKWMKGDEVPSSLVLNQTNSGSGCGNREGISSPMCPAPPDAASKGAIEGTAIDFHNRGQLSDGSGKLLIRTIQFGESGIPKRFEGALQLADNPGLGPVFVAIDRTDSSFASLGSVGNLRGVRTDKILTYDVTLDTEHIGFRADIAKERLWDWQIFPMSSNQCFFPPGTDTVPVMHLNERIICIAISNPFYRDPIISRWLTGAGAASP